MKFVAPLPTATTLQAALRVPATVDTQEMESAAQVNKTVFKMSEIWGLKSRAWISQDYWGT